MKNFHLGKREMVAMSIVTVSSKGMLVNRDLVFYMGNFKRK